MTKQCERLKYCQGCDTIDICGIINYEEVDECPCGICLVKGICNTMCNGYIRFLRMFTDRYLKIQQEYIYHIQKDHV